MLVAESINTRTANTLINVDSLEQANIVISKFKDTGSEGIYTIWSGSDIKLPHFNDYVWE